MTNEVKDILNNALSNQNLEALYNEIINNEKNNQTTLIDFENKYPNILNETNIKDILNKLKDE